ncbi:hypothetical protein AB0H92_22130 [Streptomyces phaeochromogenes]|uniref:hypothetical protein n=1 Tax=Streptomyces phaeochromogenes TaxID=1923 RepID=UPI0034035739
MTRTTRSHTIRGHLVDGGLVDLGLTEAQQQAGPDGHDTDGFSLRQTRDKEGTLVVTAGAYGPNWIRTLAELCGRLEQPFVKCTVITDASACGDHEALVRWATSSELQERKAAKAKRQAPLVAVLRRVEAEQRAADERKAIEDAGQSGLF